MVIYHIIKQFKNIGYKTFTKLYNSGVSNILDCGESVWGYDNYKCGKQVQNGAIKYSLGVHKDAPNLAVQSEMGWLNVQCHFCTCDFRYWNRLLKMKQDRLTERVVEYQFISFNEHS